MQLRRILQTIGVSLCALACLMLFPALVDLADRNADWQVFISSALFTAFLGGLMLVSAIDNTANEFSLKEGFALTTLSWVAIAAFSALPFAGLGLDYTDAYFEAMSGLTTTGSTVLTGLDNLPRGILLWRSILQAVGGIGIVVTAIIMLPFLRVGGMQLFHTESSDRSEKITPRSGQLFIWITNFYLALILICTFAYVTLGMTPFDAICHAMTTVSTGGFSTHDASLSFFQSDAILWTAIVFMLLGSLPFVVMIRALRGQPAAFYNDEQVRGFLGFVVGVSLIFAIWHSEVYNAPFQQSLLTTTFNVVSIISTTGFAYEDYTQWSQFAVVLIFLLTFVGGCAGSTAGGIKIYRFQVSGLLIKGHFRTLTSPHRVFPLSYNRKRLADDVPFSIIAFLTTYVATVAFFTLLLAALGLDHITALSAAATAIGNVGPGLGDIVGPKGSFAPLPAMAKWALSAAMLLGRLELFTVLVLLRPEFWRE